MSQANGAEANATAQFQFQGLLEKIMFSSLTTLPCCVFLSINATMLFTLRSKAVFRETSRYILLYNLLFAETVQMALSQMLYILAACRVLLTYPLCGFLVMVGNLSSDISPLTLVVMSLERFVAVCYPLRHAAIITVSNTALAIALVWAVSSVSIVIRVLLLNEFPFEKLESLRMRDFCSNIAMSLTATSDRYDKAYTSFIFVTAGAAIVASYIGVMVAARSASTDKALASKARKTLLLHLVQLGLSLLSTLNTLILLYIYISMKRIVFVRIQNVFYVCIIMLPRCLSPLIYGIRDQTIRPILLHNLCCRLKLPVISARPEVSP